MSKMWGSAFGTAAMFFLQLYVSKNKIQNLKAADGVNISESGLKVGEGGLDLRIARGLLAGSDRKWLIFLDFGDTHLHLTRGRVPESL